MLQEPHPSTGSGCYAPKVKRTHNQEEAMQDQPAAPDIRAEQYQLFILRVWQETPDGPQRFMLKAADDNHRHVFANVQSLTDFLERCSSDKQEK